MWQETAIVIIDILFCITIWPMVWNLWKSKKVAGHSLWTSVPFAAMFAVLIPLFWAISPRIALAHIPATIAWGLVALGTWRFRKIKRGGRNRFMKIENGVTMYDLDGGL